MKSLLSVLLLSVASLSGCGKETASTANEQVETTESIQAETMDNTSQAHTEQSKEDEISQWLDSHTIEEKVAQLFIITPEALTGYSLVTEAGDTTRTAINQYPVGGLIYFAKNLETPEQTRTMLENTLAFYEEAGAMEPFLTVDEEGGRVARIGGNSAFGVEQVSCMYDIGQTGDVSLAAAAGVTISDYLLDLGFNMDFAPVADIRSNPSNTVIGDRSFGSDPQLVADMVIAEYNAMEEEGITPVIKHFPGHGDTAEDSHVGNAYTNKTLEELNECELIPFQQAIDDGVQVIMVGHISTPNITDDGLPASLSSYMINDLLRQQMGFDGVVVTDSFGMGAISQNYSSADAAVMAINAGVDIILMPEDFYSAYNGVLAAVESGEISEERIDESVRRILEVKLHTN